MMRSHLWRAAGFAVVIALAGCSNDAAVRRAPHREQRKVAVTFDDIPGVAVPRSQRCKVDSFVTMNRRLLATLKANRIPAFGLVTPGGACARVRRALPGIMDMWLDAGFDLGNHSFSHFDINGTPLGRYEADVARGAQAIEPTLHKRGKKLKYFRYPFLHAGKDLETKRGFESYLTNSGYGIAPVMLHGAPAAPSRR